MAYGQIIYMYIETTLGDKRYGHIITICITLQSSAVGPGGLSVCILYPTTWKHCSHEGGSQDKIVTNHTEESNARKQADHAVDRA